MIEKTKDGLPPLPRGFTTRLRIVGVGRAGISALDQLVLYGHESYDMLAIDADQSSVDGSVVPRKELIANDMLRGLGTYGDAELAGEAADVSRAQINQAVEGAGLLLLACGLGGGIGSVLCARIALEAKRRGIPVVACAIMPFAFEGRRRLRRSREALHELRQLCDAVLVFSHERLLPVPSVAQNVRNAFYIMSQAMARSLEALSQSLAKQGLSGAAATQGISLEEIRTAFGRNVGSDIQENCWCAHGEIEGHESLAKLMERVAECPMLHDQGALGLANRAMVLITGGKKFNLAEADRIIQELRKRLPSGLPVHMAATIDENARESIRLTLCLAHSVASTAGTVSPSPQATLQEAHMQHLEAETPVPSKTSRVPEALSSRGQASPVLKPSGNRIRPESTDSDASHENTVVLPSIPSQPSTSAPRQLPRPPVSQPHSAQTSDPSQVSKALAQALESIHAGKRKAEEERAAELGRKNRAAAQPELPKVRSRKLGTPQHAISEVSLPSADDDDDEVAPVKPGTPKRRSPRHPSKPFGTQPSFQAPEIPDGELVPSSANADADADELRHPADCEIPSDPHAAHPLDAQQHELIAGAVAPATAEPPEHAPGEGGLSRNQLAKQDDTISMRFEKVVATVHQGQNLDQPAYRRKKVPFRK
ncbi:MAG: hypothetical protein ACAI35_16660 [Candidatus Methylacidiphilales bacterium]|nr:hypothetical protein [Candidatus Methylacidiphilales bacterium]